MSFIVGVGGEIISGKGASQWRNTAPGATRSRSEGEQPFVFFDMTKELQLHRCYPIERSWALTSVSVR